MSFRVAVVGATGMVGREMLKVLEQRKFPVKELVPLASARSAGKTLPFAGGEVTVKEVSAENFEGIDVAIFSAGSGPSREWSPIAADKGAIVIDNSSAWRKDPECPLVVPEVNLDAAKNRPKGIIANPNCSTIQMVVAIAPIHRVNPIKRIIVATYQAISGAGADAVDALEEQRKGGKGEALGGQLAGNLLMHWTVQEDGYYQEEELKMLHETRKILGDDSIRVSPTAVRVPVVTGHSEAITLELTEPMDVATARGLLEKAPGIELVDDFKNGVYPTPLQAAGTDPVYVGRIREDVGNPGGIQMWVVSDNLRKGAALNAVQIAEGLLL
ncbi:MAG: aspartate-semialdehyde dehydrogenase [Deltaproteobacteria bacterium]|nr:aspartate-semialdehyde dehydrogenase [Deltaproteobacteria bacterium]